MGKYTGFSDFEAFETDLSLIEQFEATGYANAKLLRGAGRYKIGNRHRDTGYEKDVIYSSYYAQGGAKLDPFLGIPVGGPDINALVNAYSEWKKGALKSKKDHEEYVKLANEKQGRAATILTPMSGPESKTILGTQPAAGKTVLG